MSASKDLVKILKESEKKGTEPYDTEATVKRIDGSTAWVHIPGGVDETPVQLTIGSRVGDNVQVRVSGGRAWLVGNASAPPTDDMMAIQASNTADEAGRLATTANEAAQSAVADAGVARAAAAAASAAASIADSKAVAASQAASVADSKAEAAGQSAAAAQLSAANASEYASRALGGLSTVQSVTETLNWITAHGTMTLTSDTALDPTHVYFVVDQNGDYVVGGTHYSVVTEPDVADISTYYELSIDESLNNYVGTHLAVTSEGLWLLPDAGGNKVLIAVGGQGHTYEQAGTYIIGKVNNVDTVLASFLASGATIGQTNEAHTTIDEDGMQIYSVDANDNLVQLANIGYGEGQAESGTAIAPYYTLGKRRTSGGVVIVGNYSVAEGYDIVASEYCSHAEGISTSARGCPSHVEGLMSVASGIGSHAEGREALANGTYTHAEGWYTTAEGDYSHAGNSHTLAKRRSQTAIGEYNKLDTAGADKTARGDYVLIIGNGTSDSARSNAFTVDWQGNVEMALDTTAVSGTDHDLYAAITALGWQSEVIV